MNEGGSYFEPYVKLIEAKSESDLAVWVEDFLRTGTSEGKSVPVQVGRHSFIANVYKRCDNSSKIKFRAAFADLLEKIEPFSKTSAEECEYYFYVISLAAIIRNGRIKERLRRWLFTRQFKGWHFESFDLYSCVILSTSLYDSDEDWANFLLETLPRDENFKSYSNATFRALLQARGLKCISLLPKIVHVLDLDDENNRSSLGYLVREACRRFDETSFVRKINAMFIAFDRTEKNHEKKLVVAVKFERLIQEELYSLGERVIFNMRKNLRAFWEKAFPPLNDSQPNEMAAILLEIRKTSKKWDFMNNSLILDDIKILYLFEDIFEFPISDETYDHITSLDSDAYSDSVAVGRLQAELEGVSAFARMNVLEDNKAFVHVSGPGGF